MATALLLLGTTTAAAEPDPPVGVDVIEHLGDQLPLNLVFTNEDGRKVAFGDVVSDRMPTLLVFAYYECPMLCGLVLKATANSAKKLGWKLGEQYRIVTVSIDPKDTPAAAKKKQASALRDLGDEGASASWPFLVGERASIRELAEAAGFKFVYDPETGQYLHPAVLIVLGPYGHVSRYLYGIDYPARDIELALTDAGQGKSGSAFSRLLLTCFRFDPATGRYQPYGLGLLRVGASVGGIAGLAALAVVMARRRRRAKAG